MSQALAADDVAGGEAQLAGARKRIPGDDYLDSGIYGWAGEGRKGMPAGRRGADCVVVREADTRAVLARAPCVGAFGLFKIALYPGRYLVEIDGNPAAPLLLRPGRWVEMGPAAPRKPGRPYE